MTVIGGRKIDATGRSSGQRKSNERTKIRGQFSPRPIEMMRSPAYQALSLSAHRVLSRIEIELANHGGMDNGKLPVTFSDFEAYGVHRHAIAPAIRELEVLGFVVVTVRGRSGVGDYRRANQFRLTFMHANATAPTNDWQRFGSVREARSASFRRAVPSQDIDSGAPVCTEPPRAYVVRFPHRTSFASVRFPHRKPVRFPALGSKSSALRHEAAR